MDLYWFCKQPSQNDKYFLDKLSIIYKHDNIMLMGDFNFTVEKKKLEVFMSAFDLEYLIDSNI